MDSRRRSRIRTIVFFSGAILGLGGLALALAIRSVAGAAIAIAFSGLFGFVVIVESVLARRRGEVPAHLEGLELGERRLVSATVDSGARCPDPRLAGAVLAHARLQLRARAALLLSAVIGIGLRAASLPSARGGERVVDLVGLVFFSVVAVMAARSLVLARRAASLNAG